MYWLLIYILKIILIIFPLLFIISFLTLFERKILAGIQRRHGPIIIGFFGLLQPFADGLKLMLKEINVPQGSYTFIFFFASFFSLFISLLYWSIIPFNNFQVLADINYSILFVFGLSSLGSFSILFSGWSSNSRYGLLGSVRAAAQLISYELPMTASIFPILMLSGTANFINIVQLQDFLYFIISFPSFIIFFICILAETNRTPFDLPEAESELVAGYNVEYSSILFALFFLAEYCNIITFSYIISLIFFQGWKNTSMLILWLKTLVFIIFIIVIRAILPRYKFVDVFSLCWKFFLPLILFYSFLILLYLLY